MAPPTEIEIIIGPRAAPEWLMRAMLHLEQRLNKQDERIIAIMSNQEHLNADLAQMNADLQSVIAELKSQAGANTILDFSQLDAFSASLHNVATGGATPATATGAPAATATASTPVDTSTSTPGAGPGVATVTGPFYAYRGSSPTTIDTTAWTQTNLQTTDTPPLPLFTFTSDTPGGEATGQSADWEVYTGPTQAAASAPAAPVNEPPTTTGGMTPPEAPPAATPSA